MRKILSHYMAALNKSITFNKTAMAKNYKTKINPHNIDDGHCIMCAFNTYLALMNYSDRIEAPEPTSNAFGIGGGWVYDKFYTNKYKTTDVIKTIVSSKTNTLETLEERVSNEIKQITDPGVAVIICIDEGAHWYTAYNHDGVIIFVDAQTGIAFNVYAPKLYPGTQIDILIPKKSVIKEYLEKIFDKTLPFNRRVKTGGNFTKSKKSRKSKNLKNKNRKSKKYKE